MQRPSYTNQLTETKVVPHLNIEWAININKVN